MSVKLNEKAFKYAKKLIEEGSVISDPKDDWSEVNPSTDKENKFLEEKGIEEYSKWYLGINPDEDSENKGAYEFPYGEFKKVHRGGVIAAKVRAGQYDHKDIEDAAGKLLEMIDKKDNKNN